MIDLYVINYNINFSMIHNIMLDFINIITLVDVLVF